VIKALTLTQPWASLMAIGVKTIETRSWKTGYRGPVAIHAGKGLGGLGNGATEGDLYDLCRSEPFRSALSAGRIDSPGDLPRGSIVAVGTLAQCERTRLDGHLHPDVAGRFIVAPDEEAFGNYDAGRWAWMFNSVTALPEPVVIPKGAVVDYRGLWDVPTALALDVFARTLRTELA